MISFQMVVWKWDFNKIASGDLVIFEEEDWEAVARETLIWGFVRRGFGIISRDGTRNVKLLPKEAEDMWHVYNLVAKRNWVTNDVHFES
jgi:hypothetical protein